MLFVLLFSIIVQVISSLPGEKILVLTETLGSRDKYSLFFETLNDRGYQLFYSTADNSSNTLRRYNKNLYDHLIIFSPAVEEFGGQIKVEEIVSFIDAGGNVLVAANSDIGDPLRELAIENGLEIDQAGNFVIDHKHLDAKDDGQHTLLTINPQDSKFSFITKNINKPILYRGIGLIKDPKNELVIDILNAYPESYDYKPNEKQITEFPNAIGTGMSLVAGIQALNNARVIFTGSIEMFSNDFFDVPVIDLLTQKKMGMSGNKDFAIALTKWVFKETGVLRAKHVKHFKKGESIINPRSYTIVDDVRYEVEIETLDDKGKWVPYIAKDIQIEFVRIDPFIRTDLTFKDGKYHVDMKLPDVYGVFQFKVNYLRKGYTHLFIADQVSVRPFQHTQYERFIPSAYPYYVSAFLMMIMFYFLIFLVLYNKEEITKKTKSE